METATSVVSADAEAVAELRSGLRGAAHVPGEPGYDEHSGAHNTAVRHRPAVIAVPADASDVAVAVDVARRHGLRVSIQATGHGATTPVVGGLLISTTELRELEIDEHTRTATVGAGVIWTQLVTAAAEVGLAAGGMATSGSVGVVGYTLGGGIGAMARRYGFAADDVLSIDVVTAAGRLRTVTGDGDGADLFWALLGGKFGFGVVTGLTMRLIPAPPLYAGSAMFPAPQIGPVLSRFASWAPDIPAALDITAMVLRMPELPQIPEPLRGQTVLQLNLVFQGSAADGRPLVDDLLAGSTPITSEFGETDPAGWLRDQLEPPPGPSWQRGGLLHEFTADTATALLDVVGPDHDVPMLGVEIRRLGGALAAPGAANSVGGRTGAYLINALGAPVLELFDTAIPQVMARLFAALEPWATGGSQLNFHGRVDADHPLTADWPAETLSRLVAIRNLWDPANVFGYLTP